jgi:hypothetical protein
MHGPFWQIRLLSSRIRCNPHRFDNIHGEVLKALVTKVHVRADLRDAVPHLQALARRPELRSARHVLLRLIRAVEPGWVHRHHLDAETPEVEPWRVMRQHLDFVSGGESRTHTIGLVCYLTGWDLQRAVHAVDHLPVRLLTFDSHRGSPAELVKLFDEIGARVEFVDDGPTT